MNESMYESIPTEREGERIDQLVPEAIHATADARAPLGRSGTSSRSIRADQTTIRRLAIVAIAEAVLIILLVVAWGIF